MKIKVIQNIFTVKYGMLENNREIEVDEKTATDLIKAKYAIEVEETQEKTTKKQTARKTAKKDTSEPKGEE